MTRDIKDIITDMREIVKPYIAQMLFNENFEGKGNTDKAEFETEFEMLLTLAERGATVEPQTGKWIELPKALNQNENPCECSNCGHILSFMNGYPKSNYCPNCGAKMEVKGDKE